MLYTGDPLVNESLYILIKSKLRGEALNLIVVNNPESWTECKRILVNRYSDASSEELLNNSLFKKRLLFVCVCVCSKAQCFLPKSESIFRKLRR